MTNPIPHTPGPWESHSASLSDNTLVVTAKHPHQDGYERICTVRDGNSREYSDADYRAQANAKLIAAAPDLLRELKSLLTAFTSADSAAADGEHARSARAAITKAEVRS